MWRRKIPEKRVLPESLHEFVVENMPLVTHVIHRQFYYLRFNEDVFQEGCYGLCLAAMNFDPDKGFEFSTYAVHMISGSIRRYMRDYLDCSLKIPRRLHSKKYELYKLGMEHPDWTETQYMDALEVDYEDYVIMTSGLASLDSPLDSDSDSSRNVSEIIADDRSDFESFMINEEALYKILEKVLDSVSENNRAIYEEWFYANLFDDGISQNNLGRKYKVSQAQVSRVINSINKKIRKEFMD